jgi:hypothetical protein
MKKNIIRWRNYKCINFLFQHSKSDLIQFKTSFCALSEYITGMRVYILVSGESEPKSLFLEHFLAFLILSTRSKSFAPPHSQPNYSARNIIIEYTINKRGTHIIICNFTPNCSNAMCATRICRPRNAHTKVTHIILHPMHPSSKPVSRTCIAIGCEYRTCKTIFDAVKRLICTAQRESVREFYDRNAALLFISGIAESE